MDDHRPFADAGEVIATFDGIRAQLTRIENQVLKTNGRVTNLELWKSYLAGSVATLVFIVGGFGIWIVENLR